MDIIQKKINIKKITDICNYIYLPILLYSNYKIDSYWVDNNDVNLMVDNKTPITISGFCESKLDDYETLGIANDTNLDFVGVVDGKEYYSGILSINDNVIEYTDGVTFDENNNINKVDGIIFKDHLNIKRSYRDIKSLVEIPLTTFEFVTMGQNKKQFRLNPNIYVNDKEFGFIKPIQTDASEINIDRKPESIFQKHSELSTISFL